MHLNFFFTEFQLKIICLGVKIKNLFFQVIFLRYADTEKYREFF